MNYTKNYQLNQWVENDRVLMEDFNRDNGKIDTVLAQLQSDKLGRCEPIDLPLQSQTLYDRTYDLSGVDWSQWEYVCIMFDIDKGYIYSDGHIRGTLNRESDTINCYCTNQGTHFIYNSIGPLLLTFLPFHDPNRQIAGICSGISGLGIGACTFGELSSITFNHDRNGGGMPPVAVAAWGIR